MNFFKERLIMIEKMILLFIIQHDIIFLITHRSIEKNIYCWLALNEIFIILSLIIYHATEYLYQLPSTQYRNNKIIAGDLQAEKYILFYIF